MRQRGFGRILTIGSVNQTSPEGLLSVYAAPKSAQYNLSINLAREYAPYGITVNNLSPGLIATERNKFRRQMLRHGRRSRPAVARCKRAGRASEMAAAVLLLCSDAGSYITGADLQATGGRIWRGRRKTRAIRQTPRAPVDSGLPLNPSDAAIAGRDRPQLKAHFLTLPVKEYAGADGRASVTGEVAPGAAGQRSTKAWAWPLVRHPHASDPQLAL